MSKRIITCLLLIISVHIVNAQKSFQVTMQFDKTIRPQGIRYYYDDGIRLNFQTDTLTREQLKPKQKLTRSQFSVFDGRMPDLRTEEIIEGQLILKRKYYAPMAVINVIYTDDAGKQYNNSFFITDKAAVIRFHHQPNNEAVLQYNYLHNAIPIFDSVKNKLWAGIMTNRIKYTAENTAFDAFIKKYPNRSGNDSLQKVFRQYYQGFLNRDMEYLSKHADNYQAFWFFRDQLKQSSETDKDYLKEQLAYVKRIFAKYLNTPGGKQLLEEYRSDLEPVQMGQPAPKFTIKTLDGRTISLKGLKGKYVLLDFWATWCPPCLAEIPFIKELRAKYPPEKLVIIGISSDLSIKQLKKMLATQHMNWLQSHDPIRTTGLRYSASSIPTLVLIDKKGKIIYKSDHKVSDQKALPKVLETLN